MPRLHPHEARATPALGSLYPTRTRFTPAASASTSLGLGVTNLPVTEPGGFAGPCWPPTWSLRWPLLAVGRRPEQRPVGPPLRRIAGQWGSGCRRPLALRQEQQARGSESEEAGCDETEAVLAGSAHLCLDVCMSLPPCSRSLASMYGCGTARALLIGGKCLDVRDIFSSNGVSVGAAGRRWEGRGWLPQSNR